MFFLNIGVFQHEHFQGKYTMSLLIRRPQEAHLTTLVHIFKNIFVHISVSKECYRFILVLIILVDILEEYFR